MEPLKPHNDHRLIVKLIICDGSFEKLREYTEFFFGERERYLFRKILDASSGIMDHVLRNLSKNSDLIQMVIIILVANDFYDSIRLVFEIGLPKYLGAHRISELVRTAFSSRTNGKFIRVVELLIENEYIGVGYKVSETESLISKALSKENVEIIEMLLRFIPDVSTYQDGVLNGSELMIRAIWCDIKILEMFLERGGDPNAYRFVGEGYSMKISVLDYALIDSKASPDKIKMLIKRGADVNFRRKEGMPTVFMRYCAKDENGAFFWEILEELFEGGVDVKAVDSRGCTALHLASELNADVIPILLSKGFDFKVRNADGLTPYDVAVRNNNDVAAEIFEKNGYFVPNKRCKK